MNKQGPFRRYHLVLKFSIFWIPAFAGMTMRVQKIHLAVDELKENLSLERSVADTLCNTFTVSSRHSY
jgi:hypothetical protein